MRTICRYLEKRLGVGPAAGPGLPPEEPSMARRVLGRALGLSTGTLVLVVMFVLSLVFPAQISRALLGVAYLYHLLAEAIDSLL